MATETPTKPSYLGTLNAISLAESGAGVYLNAWANATNDEELANCLRFVAARETSHGEVFCRRIAELGFSLLEKPDPGAAERIAKYANPKVSDLEKIGPDRGGEEADPFANIEQQMADGIYDPLTCQLMSWYIAEERDSGKVLREAYAKVRAKNGGSANGKMASNGAISNGSMPSADAQAIMSCMTAGFDRLEKALLKAAKAR
jgi:rubrerythrin